MFFPLYLANRPLETVQRHEVRDKFRNEAFARCSYADEAVLDSAINAAADSEKAMRQLPLPVRIEILETVALALEERISSIQDLLGHEVGKVRTESEVEVLRAVETFRLAAAAVREPKGEYLDLSASARANESWAVVKNVPVGAVALITPFNFPLNLAAHKVAPAIAAGCPFVLKPPSVAPLSALVLGEILSQTKMPIGSFSILPCSAKLGAKLAVHPRIRGVSFTGSSAVGWKLKKDSPNKRVLLELGGNAACIVSADFPIDLAVERLIPAIFGMAGQSCISVQRIYIERSRYAELTKALVAKASQIRSGDPLIATTTLGPMISPDDAKRVGDWIEEAKAAGARVLCGGTHSGALLQATLLENVPKAHPLLREEAFAPLACLEPFDDFDAAVAEVNQSKFGLQAGVLTRDIRKIQYAWDTLEVGGVIAGDVPTWRADAMPYGGVKESGFGREGVRYAIEDFTEKRLLVFRPS